MAWLAQNFQAFKGFVSAAWLNSVDLLLGGFTGGQTNGALGLAQAPSYANDAAAQAGGVPIGGIYRNGSVVQVRVT